MQKRITYTDVCEAGFKLAEMIGVRVNKGIAPEVNFVKRDTYSVTLTLIGGRKYSVIIDTNKIGEPEVKKYKSIW